MITNLDSEIIFEQIETPLVKQSSLNGDEEEIQSSGASVDNKRISDLVRSNMEKRKASGHL